MLKNRDIDAAPMVGKLYPLKDYSRAFQEVEEIAGSYEAIYRFDTNRVDILEAIGINVDTPLDHPAATLKKENIAIFFYVTGKAGSLREGYQRSKSLLDQGAVWEKYIAWKSIAQF